MVCDDSDIPEFNLDNGLPDGTSEFAQELRNAHANLEGSLIYQSDKPATPSTMLWANNPSNYVSPVSMQVSVPNIGPHAGGGAINAQEVFVQSLRF